MPDKNAMLSLSQRIKPRAMPRRVISEIFYCTCAVCPDFHPGLKSDITDMFINPDFL